MQQAMRQTCIASPGPAGGRTSLTRARARPGIVAARALLALAVAVSGLAFARGALAQEATPRVTIAARYPTALEAIDPLVYVVTRSDEFDESLDVSVTIASGIVSERKLSRTVTIPAGEATGEFSVPTDDLASGAATGDVMATVDNGSSYDIGDPSSASVRLHVGDPLVTVRFSEESYSSSESAGVIAGVQLIARTAPNVPAPNNAIPAAVGFQPGTATTPEDYTAGVLLISFAAAGWTADGDTFVARSTVPFTVIDDTEAEDDETLGMQLVKPPDAPDTVNFVSADGSGSECPALQGCSAGVTILDDDEAPPDDEQIVHAGAVTITAEHPTALQGIDELVFTITRAINLGSDLDVPVTLSSGIIDADRLSHTVTIGANETSAELSVHTRTLDPAAVTGDVIATADDGEPFDVPDPPTASVRVYVGDPLVTVRLNAASYTVAEGGGSTEEQIALLARTEPSVPAPTGTFYVALSTRSGTATSPDDFEAFSRMVPFPGSSRGAWVADGDAFVAEVRVPLTILDDTEIEGDERLRLLQQRSPGLPSTVHFSPADPEVRTCSSIRHCEAAVTIVDDDNRSVVVSQGELTVDEGNTETYTMVLTREPSDDVTITPEVQSPRDADILVSGPLTFTPQDWSMPRTVTVTAAADSNRDNGSATITHAVTGADYEANGVTATQVRVAEIDAEGRTVVTLVRVPDGTVIPDDSTLTVGETVVDGSTFPEDERVLFRLLFSAADGGPAPGGADVELSFQWIHHSPIVPISGEISRIVLSLPRVDVWDSAVQILDNEVGNPDSTVRVRITGCWRNGCVIGEPSEITVTIADDDGGPEAAPPGPPVTPWVLCPDRGHSAQGTGLKVIWESPEFVGGAPVEHYELRYRQRQFVDDEFVYGDWQIWPHSVPATSMTITGLETDTAYGVQVRAVNANGPGEWSFAGIHRTGEPDYICDILDQLAESQ